MTRASRGGCCGRALVAVFRRLARIAPTIRAKKWHRRLVWLLCVLNVVSLAALIFALFSLGEDQWSSADASARLRIAMTAKTGYHPSRAQFVQTVTGAQKRHHVVPAGRITPASFPPSPPDNTSWPPDPERPWADCVWQVTAKKAPAALQDGWEDGAGWRAENLTGHWVRCRSITQLEKLHWKRDDSPLALLRSYLSGGVRCAKPLRLCSSMSTACLRQSRGCLCSVISVRRHTRPLPFFLFSSVCAGR